MSIEVRKVSKDVMPSIEGGIVLDGFPSTGLVNSIASECLMRSTGTQLFAVIDSPDFPAVSIINKSMPQFPARLHVNESLKVAFFVSEFNIQPAMQQNLAKTILNWTLQNKCKMIISAVGITSKQDSGKENAYDEQPVFAIASTTSAAKIIQENGFTQLLTGTIGGIPATLLNEGSLLGLDVIVLVVNTILDAPDFRAAAIISNAISKLVPGLSCDIGSLIVQAQVVENEVKQIRDVHKEFSHIA